MQPNKKRISRSEFEVYINTLKLYSLKKTIDIHNNVTVLGTKGDKLIKLVHKSNGWLTIELLNK